MKTDASGITRARLVDHLRARYGVDVVDVAFQPKGEDAYGYAVTAAGGRRYWARLQPADCGRGVARALAALLRLRGRVGLDAAVLPIPTRRGAATSVLEGHAVALFPFVEGPSAHERRADDDQVAAVARAMAALHASPVPGSRRVRLRDPCGPAIRALLTATDGSPGEAPSAHAAEAARLLRAHRAGLLDALAVADGLGARLEARPEPWVVLHGDPNWANVLLGDDGRVRIVDWGGLCVGPREWDLAHVGGDRFDLFLGAYLGVAGPVRLAEEAFRYHGYRWALQEVSDYAGRLLGRVPEPEEAEHALTELRAYVPVPIGAITAEAERALAVLRGVGADTSRRRASAVGARQDAAGNDLLLATERLVLRDFVEADLERVHAMRSDPEVARFRDFEPESLDGARAWLEGVIDHNRRRPREAYNLAIALPDGRAIGWIGFGRSSRYPVDAGEYGVGYLLAREQWGRGYASEALRAAIGFMRQQLGARRVSAWCWVENRASARVMEKAGMRFWRRSERTEPKSRRATPVLEYAAAVDDRTDPRCPRGPCPDPEQTGGA